MIAVMDIDSPEEGRFDRDDQEGLERIAAAIQRAVAAVWPEKSGGAKR